MLFKPLQSTLKKGHFTTKILLTNHKNRECKKSMENVKRVWIKLNFAQNR